MSGGSGCRGGGAFLLAGVDNRREVFGISVFENATVLEGL